MHEPVLLKEVLDIFDPQPGQTYIDMTVNGGGHARAIARRVGASGRVLGIDWDCGLIRESGIRNKELGVDNLELVCGNYAHVAKIVKEQGIDAADGILFDLGFSSYHMEASGRGFSFQKDEPLDMRYSIADQGMSAEHFINHAPRRELERIMREYGGERYAGRIAGALSEARRRRPIRTSRELARIVAESVPARYRHGRLHPATRTFQAVRIAVNRELENLASALTDAGRLLGPHGVMIAISFHSLEERIVKNFFKKESREHRMHSITPKPVSASREERFANPGSRSARLRAARIS